MATDGNDNARGLCEFTVEYAKLYVQQEQILFITLA